MRSALKLTAFSLLLTGCAEQLDDATNESELIETQPEVIQTEQVDMRSLQTEFSELIDCKESFEVIEGDFQTVVCNQGVIRLWEEPLNDTVLAPWLIWCEPTMAAGGEPGYEVLFGERFIIENQNPDTIGSSSEVDLCSDLANRELQAFEPSSDDSYGLLTNLAQSGLCMEPPRVTATTPLRHVCSGFGLEGKEFTLWLETGEVETLVNKYSAECGAGVSGTYGENWLKTTYDLDVVVSGERLDELLSLISPLPFSNLCDSEEGS